MDTLLSVVRRYADAHVDHSGLAQTPIPGLMIVRATEPSDLIHAVFRPLICLVVQGSKQVATGAQSFAFAAGDSLIVTADVPTVSQVTSASLIEPYLSLVFELNPTVIAELLTQMEGEAGTGMGGLPVRVHPTDVDVADAALRLMRLLDRPASVPVLHAQLVRELHYWLLIGRHGPAIRRLGWTDGHEHRVTRAITVLRTEFAQPLPVERLAAVAGMSPSSFHQHFRALTSLSPLQFQKQLRLIEAKRLMQAEGVSASHAAFTVGYESVSQFTREYRRMFGLPPLQDISAARQSAGVPA